MAIKASAVKELRQRTGAGMMDCKKALQETDGDMDKAIDYLREKGISKAQKKAATRVAADGLAHVVEGDEKAVLYEVNSETDFVAKNDEFVNLMKSIGSRILAADVDKLEDALQLEMDGETVENQIMRASGKLGEKISFRRMVVREKSSDQVFGSYVHMGGKIGALVVLEGGDETLARDVAMHVAAINPSYLSEDDVPEDFIEHEKSVLHKEALNEGKPEHIVEKMVQGRLNKRLKEICLVHQPFVKDQDVTVGQHVKDAGASIISFDRFEVGEGIEVEEENFADEVKSMSA